MRTTTAVWWVMLGLGAGACAGEARPEPGKTEAKAAEPAKAEAKAAEPAKAEAKAAEPAKAEAKAAEPASDPPKPGLAVALPAAKDGESPAVVFGALAHHERGKWEVDIVDFSGLDVKALERDREDAMMRGMEEDEDEAVALGLLEPKSPLLPKGFAVGDPWTLVTPAGAEHRTAKGFRAISMGGSGQLHLYVDLGKAPKTTKRPALAFRGHLPATVTLELPAPKAPADVGPDVQTKLVAALEPQLGPDQREILGRHPIQGADFELHPGRFPGGRTHAAFLMADASPDDDDPPISAFLFVKADGSAEVAFIPDVFGTVELLGLLDVDGDGQHELFYEHGYHEGWYLEMLQWDGDTAVMRTVTGDGI